MRNLLRAGLVVLFLPSLLWAQDMSAVEITTTKITDSIYMLEGSGGNIAVCVGEDGTFIVDDQFAPLTEKIKAAIAAITPHPVQFVINTHWHFDHTDGNENLGGEGAIIVSHENSRERMEVEQFIALAGRRQEAYPRAGLPKITFTESMRFHYNAETIDILHFGPAHTDGDAVVRFAEANVLHTGDVFVRYVFPFIDEPNGGSISGMIEFVERLIDMSNEETRIIPGHGPISSKQDMVAFVEMLRTIRGRVQSLIDASRNLEEIIAADPTRGYQGSQFVARDDFVKIVYDSLRRERRP